MMGWYKDGMGWGGWIAMTLMMVAFWGLVILAVVAIFRGTITIRVFFSAGIDGGLPMSWILLQN